MIPTPEQVIERVTTLMAGQWPRLEAERRIWFDTHGLSSLGSSSLDAEAWPLSIWRVKNGQFVGLAWSFWTGEHETLTREAAERLFAGFNARFALSDELVSPGQGFSSLWRHGELQVDCYFHEPRTFQGRSIAGSVQLHLDHAARAADEEAASRG